MSAVAVLPWLLVLQGAMGGFDTLVNHEIIERLPHRPSAHTEIGWHAIRETTYAVLFVGLGLYEWHGSAALVIAAFIALELVVTSCDEWVENRTRVLPQNERVMHVFLTLNLGLIVAVLAVVLGSWYPLETAIVHREPGLAGWILLALGLTSAGWSVRDAIAWRRLGRLTA